MKYEIYSDLKASSDLSIFDFNSVGKHGIIPKRIIFAATELDNVYNLAFGDIDENGEIDDYRTTNNGDRNKILATIAEVIKVYTQKYPGRIIFFRGSTIERTRLYRMAVSLNLDELSVEFDIYGVVGDKIMPFKQNMDITAFLIKRKIV